jgi:hypothetical protein
MFRKTLLAVCCLPALVVLAGCGGSSASVEGTVSVDGTPVDHGSIVFAPAGGSGATVGTDIRDGKYTLPTERGLTSGKYKVEITWNKKTGKKMKDVADTGAVTDDRMQVLPEKFNKNTELTTEIKGGANGGVNFELKSGGQLLKNAPGKAVGD